MAKRALLIGCNYPGTDKLQVYTVLGQLLLPAAKVAVSARRTNSGGQLCIRCRLQAPA